MRKVSGLIKRALIVTSLVALTIVLFPNHTEPLWDWAKSTGTALGSDPLPTFDTAQGYAGLGLLGMVIGGIAYNLWRDRRLEVLQAEYDHKTGATNLKQKVRDLETQLDQVTKECQEWKEAHRALSKEHTTALLTSKEHEIHSQYGREDRETLKELRKAFDDFLQAKAHTEGFREAMELMIADLSQNTESPAVSAKTMSSTKGGPNGSKNRPSLPFGGR